VHIVFLTNEYPKKGQSHGGIGTFVKFLAEKLIAKDFNISVVGINNHHKNKFSNEGGINIHRLKKSLWKFAKFYQHKNRIVKKLQEIYKFKYFKSMKRIESVGWINDKSEISSKIMEAIITPEKTGKDRKKWLERIVLHPLEDNSNTLKNTIIECI
jgi:glycosyltransferase involved in cell wall biosynthesis